MSIFKKEAGMLQKRLEDYMQAPVDVWEIGPQWVTEQAVTNGFAKDLCVYRLHLDMSSKKEYRENQKTAIPKLFAMFPKLRLIAEWTKANHAWREDEVRAIGGRLIRHYAYTDNTSCMYVYFISSADDLQDTTETWYDMVADIYIWASFPIREQILDVFRESFEYEEPEPEPLPLAPKINLLMGVGSRLHIKQFELFPKEVKDFYYSEDCVQKLTKSLTEPGPGLIFMPGKAGSGKTTLLRYLSGQIEDRKFIFMPHNQLQFLSNPGTMDFVVEQLSNSVLILEDAEGLFVDREQSNGNAGLTSLLLNLTDGMLGELLNMRIVCTQNTTANVDSAFLREGRVKFNYYFDALPSVQAQRVAEDIGLEAEVIASISKPMVLADIFALKTEETEINEGTNRGPQELTTTGGDLRLVGELE